MRVSSACDRTIGAGSALATRPAPRQGSTRHVDDGLARQSAETIRAVLGTVVALLIARCIDVAVTTISRAFALRRATTVRIVEDAVIASLGAVDDSVAAIRRKEATWRATTVSTVIVEIA